MGGFQRKHMIRSLAGFLVILLWSPGTNGAPPVPLEPGEVDRIVAPLLKWHPHAVIAIDVRQAGQPDRFYAGRAEMSTAKAPAGDSLFQVGSVTKVFTGLLLAVAVENKELKLSDPVTTFLPPALKLPKRGTREITFEELATHTSGLPRLPPDFVALLALGGVPAKDPYSTLTEASLGRGVSLCVLKDEESPKYAYSNLGMGLLGHALCHHAGVDYETLLKQRITQPLGMPDTVLVLTDEQKLRYFPGHDPTGQEVPPWKFGMLEGAGALYSTTNDLQTLLEAERGRTDSPLMPALLLSQEQRRSVSKSLDLGLGWHQSGLPDHRFWWHNGATFGHTAFVAFCREPQVSVVILCNEGINPLTGQSLADRVGFPLMRRLITGEPLPEPDPPESRSRDQ